MEEFQRREKVLLEIVETREEKEHFHQDIELLYVLEGKIELYIDGQKIVMYDEDVMIINANKRHYLKSLGEVLYVKLTIMYELFSDILNNYEMLFLCDSARNIDVAYTGLRKLIQQLLGHYLSNKGKVTDFAYISLCYQIMDYICMHFLIQSSDLPEKEESDKYQLRIQQIDNYIRTNYRSAISMKELSEKLYLSNGYLSRFFKKNYGMSFADYLTNVRLHHAVDQLLYTDIPITRIVYDNGFSSVALFNKAFKKEYGETPSAVRKRGAGNKKTKQHTITKEMEKKLENVLWKDSGQKTDADMGKISGEVSAAVSKPLNRIWQKVINVGSAQDLLRSEVQEHVMLLKDSLKFTYVRFWNAFSKEMLIDINNPEHKYNFSRLDSVLDFLVEHDIYPFIELENKPKRVEKTTSSSLLFELFEDITSLENWESILEVFLKHVVSRYGREEVGHWKFELWFDAERIKEDIRILNYAERFKIAKKIIHTYTDAQIGGCGMHGYSKTNEKKSIYIRAFYKKLQSFEIIPDFLTLYAFAYDSYEQDRKYVSHPSSDVEFMSHVVDNMEQDWPELAERLDVYFTEWNLTISDRNLINDSCFKGAYILKNYIDLIDRVEGMSYFVGSDRVSEYYDTEELLFGGTGLLTKDGIQKPAMFAFHFLNRLYSEYVGKGSHYLVTKDGYGNYGIVCHNCRKLGYNYYYVEEDCLDQEHFSKYFEDLEPLELNLNLTDIADGIYRIKIYRINDENGSIQKVWKEMGYATDLSREDLRYFQRVCEPKVTMHTIKSENGSICLKIPMLPNEIAYLDINCK